MGNAKIYTKKGFSLLEFLIYSFIVCIVLIISAAIFLNIMLGKEKLMATEEVSQSSRFVMEKISESIRNAESINNPGPGLYSTSLSLKMIDLSKNPSVLDLANGIVRIKEGTGSIVNLTPTDLVVTNLRFSNISYTGSPGTIRIQMTVKHFNPENKPENDFEKTYYATANIGMQ